MIQQIREIIRKSMPDAEVHVFDPHQDNTHFEAVVISPEFQGLPLVKQHQRVMNALKNEFSGSVHALALKTFTPEKWQSQKENYTLS